MQTDTGGDPPATQTAARPTTCNVDRYAYPTLHLAASMASRSGRRQYIRFVWLNLGFLILASALEAFSVLKDDNLMKQVAYLITLSMFGAIIVSVAIASGRPDRHWFGGRAVAESVKTSAWRYMMRAEPYDTDDAAAEQRLDATLQEILDSDAALKLELRRVPGVIITHQMRQVRALPVGERKACYQVARVQDQLNWYKKKEDENRQAAKAWFAIGVGAQSAALVAALIGTQHPESLDFIGVFAAVAAATTALTQLHRHDELAKSYHLAAHELARLKVLIDGVHRDAVLQECVKDTEAAISREHTMWIARRDRIL